MTATTGFKRDNQGYFIRKDPDSVMDYFIDYSTFLESSDSIASQTTTVDTGLTLDSSSIHNNNKKVILFVSGGTAGTVYTVKTVAVTANALTLVHRFRIKCEEIYLT